MDNYHDDFDYTDEENDNDDFDFHHGNVDDLYDDVGDDYGYDAWGIQSDGEDETPFTIPIPADLAEFYPERKSCVKSFLELYVLCGKILKMIRLIDDYYLYYNLEDGKFVKDVKTVQAKCRFKIRSALGKVVPLPSVVVDKLLDHILGSESLSGEDYKFEDISASDIGPLNLMYGKISSVYQYLRKCNNEEMAEMDEIDLDEENLIKHADIGDIGEFWEPPEVQLVADIGDREDEEVDQGEKRNVEEAISNMTLEGCNLTRQFYNLFIIDTNFRGISGAPGSGRRYPDGPDGSLGPPVQGYLCRWGRQYQTNVECSVKASPSPGLLLADN